VKGTTERMVDNVYSLKTDFTKLRFEVLNDSVRINSKLLYKNNSYIRTNYFQIILKHESNLNFWAVTETNLEYYGDLNSCKYKSNINKNVIAGTIEVKKSLVRGIVLTFAIIILIILVSAKINKLKKHEKKIKVKFSTFDKIVLILLNILLVVAILPILFPMIMYLLYALFYLISNLFKL
jgi:hypothetical protein